MSGNGQITIQPSSWARAQTGETWFRAIPAPGVTKSDASHQIAAIDGVAGCSDLLASSPPTLLELYEIYSYSIGALVTVDTNAPAAATAITMELALLVNDRVAYFVQQSVPERVATESFANFVFSSDLVNPIRLGARDRLGLRIGVTIDDAAINAITVAVGAQFDPGAHAYVGFESTISYNVLDVPASRRL